MIISKREEAGWNRDSCNTSGNAEYRRERSERRELYTTTMAASTPKHQTIDTLAESYTHGLSPLTSTSRNEPLRTFLFGDHIAHSMAPLLHKTLFASINVPWTYKLNETPDLSLLQPSVTKSDVIGCAVTMPHKVPAVELVDALTDEGKKIGAINTIFTRVNGKGEKIYVGTNTDCIGVRESFLQNCPGVLEKARGRPALVIGGGGACRSAVYALDEWLGASEVYMVSREPQEVVDVTKSFQENGFKGKIVHVQTLEQAKSLPLPFLAVGTVPDFPPKSEGEILARQITEEFLGREGGERGVMLEMCYHPRPRTELYDIAEKKGWKVLPGTEAMIYQGVAQQVLWAELPLEKFAKGVEEAKRVVGEELAKH